MNNLNTPPIMLLALAALSLAHVISSTSACSTDEDCSLNGKCTGSACVCNPGWGGSHGNCSQLDRRPPSSRMAAAVVGMNPNVCHRATICTRLMSRITVFLGSHAQTTALFLRLAIQQSYPFTGIVRKLFRVFMHWCNALQPYIQHVCCSQAFASM